MAHSIIPSFRAVSDLIQRSIAVTVLPQITQAVEQETRGFQRMIRLQRFPAVRRVPLSPRWAAFKRRRGLDGRTLIATGHYIRNLRTLYTLNRHRRTHTWTVGAPAGLRARTPDGKVADITLRALAAAQEFGGRNLPARPHWRPFWTVANVRLRQAILRANRAGVAFVQRALRASRRR